MRNKRNDQVFTPQHIVTKMLDDIGYIGDDIRYKTIFEPSFGDGAFLVQIVERILNYSIFNRLTKDEIIAILDNVYGFEIDKEVYEKAIDRLNMLIHSYGLRYDWPNLICGDTTKLAPENKFDFVISNPPYIRIHDLKHDERARIEQDFQFGQGNTDMYVIFFELGINSLKSNGKLCYITPNSFLKNSSQKQFRKYLVANNMVESIADYGSNKVFDNADTYAAIILLNKNNPNKTTKYTAMKIDDNSNFIIHYETSTDLTKFGDNAWNIANDDDANFIKKIESRKTKLSDLCDVQYGLATNADGIYIINKDAAFTLEPDILRPVIKASTLSTSNVVIFPYVWNDGVQRYEVMNEDELKENYPNTYNHLLNWKYQLEERDMEKNAKWYQYGRSQGIQNSNKKKFVLKHILHSSAKKCEFVEVDEKTLVYSGVFITVKDDKNVDVVRATIESEELARWLILCGKDMSGGYKSIKAKDIKDFRIDNNTLCTK